MNKERNLGVDIAARSVTPRPDCQIWTGATDRGYGRICVDGVVKRVHRVAWELTYGPIPEGSEVDHLCGIKACVNVEHLELVSHTENTRRGVRAFARRRRTHCKKGHPITPDNTMVNEFTDPDFKRCATCERERKRRRKAT